MALRALLMRKQIDDKKNALADLRSKDADFTRREAELEAAIQEAESEEDRQAVESLVSEFEEEKSAHQDKETALEDEIRELEENLAAEEAKQPAATPPAQNPTTTTTTPADGGERKDEHIMSMNRRGLFALDAQRRSAFLAREDIKDFLQRVRTLGVEKRAVSGAELTIPDVMLDLIREAMPKYSKLLSKVNMRPVPGKARQNIMGAVPEAIWTEACAALNEMDMTFSQTEVDGYKVGGYIAICNATLEDSDLNLASEIMDAISQALGYAIDKAILYGTGKKMPLGIVTRLAQQAKPADWPANGPEFVDVHTTNLLKITGKTGVELYKELILDSGAAVHIYARGGLTWCMSEKTKTMLTAEAMSINAAGAIVTGINNTMPVIGGDIVTLDFIPDGDIIFGYFELYLLAQRAGAALASSEHVRFIEDQTVFKGTARYDGKPVFGEAFCVVNIKGTEPTTTMTFAPDKANPVLTSLSLSDGTLKPAFDPKVYSYTASATGETEKVTAAGSEGSQVTVYQGVKPYNSGEDITLQEGDNVLNVVVSAAGRSRTYTVKVNKAGG